LPVVVIDADVFDDLFGEAVRFNSEGMIVFDKIFDDIVAVNSEGRVISDSGMTGFPFTAESVRRFCGDGEPMQAAGAAVLTLAWSHRERLLG